MWGAKGPSQPPPHHPLAFVFLCSPCFILFLPQTERTAWGRGDLGWSWPPIFTPFSAALAEMDGGLTVIPDEAGGAGGFGPYGGSPPQKTDAATSPQSGDPPLPPPWDSSLCPALACSSSPPGEGAMRTAVPGGVSCLHPLPPCSPPPIQTQLLVTRLHFRSQHVSACDTVPTIFNVICKKKTYLTHRANGTGASGTLPPPHPTPLYPTP